MGKHPCWSIGAAVVIGSAKCAVHHLLICRLVVILRPVAIAFTRSTAAAVEALAQDAAGWIAERVLERYAPLLKPLGTTGRFHTHRDIYDSLEFLSCAIELQEPRYFRDYVRWMIGVLESRGLARGMVREFLDLLEDFLTQRLCANHGAEVQRFLRVASEAISGPDPFFGHLYRHHMPAAFPNVDDFTQALVHGETAVARQHLRQGIAQDADYLVIATHLVQPALYDIGTLWECNKITVAQEHMATVIIQMLLAELYMASPTVPQQSERKVLLACVEHNRHAVGMRILADALELAGCRVRLLGADTPSTAVLAQVADFAPDAVGLSASLVQQLPMMSRAIAAIRHEFGQNRPHLMVGGIAVNQFDGMWRRLGADAWYPDAESALIELR